MNLLPTVKYKEYGSVLSEMIRVSYAYVTAKHMESDEYFHVIDREKYDRWIKEAGEYLVELDKLPKDKIIEIREDI
jgi:hypothetical protein